MSATATPPSATTPAISELRHWINGLATPGTSARFADVYHPSSGCIQSRVPLATADEEGTRFEGRELVGGDKQLVACEGLGAGDAIASRELEDDAAGVFARREEVLLDVEREGIG